MVSLFGFGQPKCVQCGMKLTEQVYEWQDKKFCCLDCKKAYRKGSDNGASCH